MCQKQTRRKLIKEAKENFPSSSADLETASVKSAELHYSVHSASLEKNIFFDEIAHFFPPLSAHATSEIIFLGQNLHGSHNIKTGSHTKLELLRKVNKVSFPTTIA
ncbi:hypothetical protein NPIL_86001 [Nephila pilipes]|uniref:Uncharacterized protein n=1 Tax=Nephila pilipes TaxID=299642 RepID=A0A8X6QI78_NEPPI|nr:hypothetical protein NPIL_86001 [Nephila pilipes]